MRSGQSICDSERCSPGEPTFFSGGSYGSSSDQRVHFGLGQSSKIEKTEIHWPSGLKQEIMVPAVDRIFSVAEGKGIVP